MSNKYITILFIFFLLLFPVFLMADNIDSTYKYSWGENIGWMSWKPIYNSTEYGVTVYNECLTGYIWAENGGWIKIGDNSANCSSNDCCQNGTTKGYENDSNGVDNDGDGKIDDWGVNNDGSGVLSGYAWGENIGWIKFNTSYSTTTIDSNGYFTNYAWGENVGWVNMNCTNTEPSYCGTVDFKVKTSWTSNTLPFASSVSINSGAASIVLNEGTTTNVVCTATVTDNNGYSDITTTTAKLYLTSVGADAADDTDNHYTLSGSKESYCTGSGTTGNCTTTFAVYYYANPGEWTCKFTPSDSEGAGTAATDTITMNETQYLDVSATINYGSVNAGANSTGDHIATTTNTGNTAIDVNISGTAMSCNVRGSIPVGNQEYATSSFAYGTGTPLSATSTDWNLDLPKPDSDNPIVTDKTYWQVGVPIGVEGTCAGTNTFTVRSAM